MNQPIVNPFKLLAKNLESQSSGQLESTSSVRNEIPGQCPKCYTPMDTVNIGYVHSKNTEPVFWCGTCKVSTPKPEA